MALSENPTLEEIINEVERLNNLIVDRGGAQTITPSTSNKVLSKGNYKGDITILGDSDLISSNIRSGKNIFGINGSLVEGVPNGKRWASGNTTSPSGKISFTTLGGGSVSMGYVSVGGLNFTPSTIFICFQGHNPFQNYEFTIYRKSSTNQSSNNCAEIFAFNYSDRQFYQIKAIGNVSIHSTGFTIPAPVSGNYPYFWIAYE